MKEMKKKIKNAKAFSLNSKKVKITKNLLYCLWYM